LTHQIVNKLKRYLLAIGILTLTLILGAAEYWYTVLPYRASQFILVTSNEYNWPEDHIFAMLPDGSHMTRLVRGTEPACSPNGRQIAFVGVDNPQEHFYAHPAYIFVMDSDGTNIKQLTSGRNWGFSPSWSSDGTKIAFQKGGGVSGIGIIDTITLAIRTFPFPDPTWDIFDLVWSPDGHKFAFGVHTQDSAADGLYISNVDGSETRKLVDGEISAVAWSPNGQSIVFTYGDQENILRVITPNGNIVRDIKLPAGIQIWSRLKWSPDSKGIIFSGTGKENHYAIYYAKKDGSDLSILVQAGWATWGQDVGENFPLPRPIIYGNIDWCEVH